MQARIESLSPDEMATFARTAHDSLVQFMNAQVISAGAAYGVYETGHRGGALVHRHGAGVEVASARPAASDSAKDSTTDRDVN